MNPALKMLFLFSKHDFAMAGKHTTFLILILLTLAGCSGNQQFPELQSERIEPGMVTWHESPIASELPVAKVTRGIVEANLKEMPRMKQFYTDKDSRFDAAHFEKLWENYGVPAPDLNGESQYAWLDVTGFLLELTGEAGYAGAIAEFMKNARLAADDRVENLLKSLTYTKSADHIHINLFVNSSVEYQHTFGGKVKITQQKNSGQPENIQVSFEMEQKQYVELYIRIPSDATQARVSVGNVKYVAIPGEYCRIAKKWVTGDTVEIRFN